MSELTINPESKIGAILEARPELEPVLLRYAPAFEKLRSPLLRKTVARVATIRQAAAVAGVDVRDLVLKLREAAGLPPIEVHEHSQGNATSEPEWMNTCEILESFDADAMLARNEHPLAPVMARARDLQDGQQLVLTSSFRPEPLIEKLRSLGHAVHSAQHADMWKTHVGPKKPDPCAVVQPADTA